MEMFGTDIVEYASGDLEIDKDKVAAINTLEVWACRGAPAPESTGPGVSESGIRGGG